MNRRHTGVFGHRCQVVIPPLRRAQAVSGRDDSDFDPSDILVGPLGGWKRERSDTV